MGDFLSLQTAIYGRLGAGYGTANAVMVKRSINWAQDRIAKTPFNFLRAEEDYVIVEDKIKYRCPTDFNYVESVILQTSTKTITETIAGVTTTRNWTDYGQAKLYPTRKENITRYNTGYTTWKAGRAHNLYDVIVPTTPNGFQYKCTTAGTSAAAIEPVWPIVAVGETITDGTGALVWTSQQTHTNKSAPKYYCVSDSEGTTTIYRNIYFGCPSPDNGSYIIVLSYFKKPTALSGDTDVSLITSVYEDTPLISGGLYKFAKDMGEEELASVYYAEFMLDISDMKLVCPYRLGDDFTTL